MNQNLPMVQFFPNFNTSADDQVWHIGLGKTVVSWIYVYHVNTAAEKMIHL